MPVSRYGRMALNPKRYWRRSDGISGAERDPSRMDLRTLMNEATTVSVVRARSRLARPRLRRYSTRLCGYVTSHQAGVLTVTRDNGVRELVFSAHAGSSRW